jgi:hypothetical protein
MPPAESILEIVVGTPFLLTALAVLAALIYWSAKPSNIS